MTFHRRSLLTTSCLTVLMLAPAAGAHANPVGGTVSAGSASIASAGDTLTVKQNTQKTVIDWRGFNIGQNETTQFVQPNKNAIALNRVNSNSASDIEGKLTANGNVIIVNQNGVLFGPHAQVNVNGLIATTADISNKNFMAGKMTFDKAGNPDASIINQGNITARDAGLVGFVAPNVVNSGTITARLGHIQLASGDTATVDMYGDGLMEVAVSDKVKSQLVSNSGLLQADGGTVAMTAAAGAKIVNSLISNTGALQAQSVGTKNGEIIIGAAGSNKTQKTGASTVLVGGTVDASGYQASQTGGKVTVTADNVGILDGATIDASGANGGGTVKIGGDFHGAGTTATALHTIVQSGATIKADAITKGKGGSVAVWSDDTTTFAGNISAKGGGQSGDGGMVETSGHNTLSSTGEVDASAANGAAGEWLLDPNNITIQASGSDTNVTGNPNFTTTNDSAIVTTTSIQNALNAGTSVNITTGSGGTNSQAGTITINSGITKSSGGNATLTLSAATDIADNGSNISSTNGNLNIIFDANTAGGGGSIYIGSASLLSNGGNITLGGGANAATGYAVGDAAFGNAITLNGSTINASGGNIIMNGQGYATTANGNFGIYQTNSGGSIQTNGAGTIALTGVGGGTGASTGNNGIQANGTISAVNGNITLTGTGGNTTGGSDDGVVGAGTIQSTGTGTINLIGQGGSNSSGSSNQGVSLNTATISSQTGNINITGTGGVVSSDGIQIYGTNNLTSTGSANINLTGTGSYAGIVLQATGTKSIGGASDTGNITLTADTLSLLSGTLATQTTGTVAFKPYTASTTIGVNGGTGTLQLTSGILGAITGESGITIGGGTGYSGLITVTDYSWTVPITYADGTGNVVVTNAGSMIVAKNTTLTGSGNLTLAANADITVTSNVGITTNGGSVTLDADTGGSGGSIYMDTGASILSNGGNITMGGGATPGTGYAVGDATSIDGVSLKSTTLNAAGGNIILNGQGYATSGNSNYGIYIWSGTTVQTNGTGTIALNGIGGGTGASNNDYGLQMNGTISGVNGNITLTGTGANTTGGYDYGIGDSGTIQSTGLGTINLTGQGGGGTSNSNNGIALNVATISSQTGDINLTGLAGSGGGSGYATGLLFYTTNAVTSTGSANINLTGVGNASGISFSNAGTKSIGGASDTGNITLKSDTLNVGVNPTIQTTGTVTIKPYTASTTVGFSGGTGTLAVTQALIDSINAPTVIVGRNDSTGLLTTGAFSWESTLNNLYLEGGSVTINGAITKASGTNNALLDVISASDIYQYGYSISSSGSYGQLSTIFDADYALAGGAITENGSINSNGGNITFGGGANPVTTGAIGDAAHGTGVSLSIASLDAGGGNIILNGTGYAGGTNTSNAYGIYLGGTGGSVVKTSGSGTINFTGYGGGSGSGTYADGMYITGAGTDIQVQNGNLNLTGTGGSTTGNYDDGIYIQGSAIAETIGTGNINFTGYGGGTGAAGSAAGVGISTTVRSTATGGGGISITGTGGDIGGSGGVAQGVSISGPTGISSVDGNINIVGTGSNSSGTSNAGVSISGTTNLISSTGNATITVNGTGGGSGASSGNVGIALSNTTGISTVTSAINLTGIGGTGTGGSNRGFYFYNGSGLTSTGSAAITLTGISGTGGSNNDAIIGYNASGTNTFGGASDTGNITFNANNLSLATGTNIQTTGVVTFKPYTTTTTVGTAGAAGTLQVTSAILGYISSASEVDVGALGDTGLLSAGAYTWGENAKLISGTGGISITGAQTMGAHNLTLQTDGTLNIGANLSGTGTLTLEPASAATTIGVNGGTGTLGITATDLGYIQSGFAGITVGGGAGYSGLITVTDYAWNAPITYADGTGNVVVTNSTGSMSVAKTTTLTGTGNLTLSALNDVSFVYGIGITTQGGSVTIDADNTDTNGSGSGAIIFNGGPGSGITTNGGNITLGGGTTPTTMAAIGDATNNYGVYDNGSPLNAGGGNILIRGNGYAGTTSNGMYGVDLNSTVQTSGTGTIGVYGTGGGTGASSSDNGIILYSNADIKVVNGNMTMVGYGNANTTGGSNTGVRVHNGAIVETTGTGNISLTGYGQGAGSSGSDVGILNYSGTIRSTATGGGSITLNGYGGDSGGTGASNYGVWLFPYLSANTISSVDGNIYVNGTGGTGSGSSDNGIYLTNLTSIFTTGLGSINLTGIKGSTGFGISTSNSLAIGGASTTGNINLTTDTFNFSGTPTFQTTGTVTIAPYTASTTIAFGGTGSSGTLGITQAMMDAINAPTVIIGRTDSTGALTTGTFNWESTLNNLYLEGGNDIINGNITKAAGSNNGLLDVMAGSDILQYAYGISSSGAYGQLNTVFDADTALAGGSINLIGGSISSNGGYITLGGGATPATGYAVGDAVSKYGINVNGEALNAGGGNIILNGQGYASSTANNVYGIWVQTAGSVQTSGTGTINLTGIAGGTGASNTDIGVYVTATGSTVKTTGSGTLSVTGTGGDLGGTGYSNHGVMWDVNNGFTTTGTGNIIVQGTGGTGDGSTNSGVAGNDGIKVNALISTAGGNISLTGFGGNSAGSYNLGVEIPSSSITAAGNGTITVNGTGGGTGGAERGIWIANGGVSINSVNGAINLTGAGSNSADGINLKDALSITSSGNAPITLTATVGDILFTHNSTQQTQTIGGAGYSGNIKFITNAINLSNTPTIQTTGTVTIAPYTASTTVGVAGGTGTLAVTQALINDIAAGTIIIGATNDTGAMNVNASTWAENAQLITGSGLITISGAQALGANNFTLETDTTPVLSSTIISTGTVNIEPATASTSIGFSGGVGTLQITQAMMNSISAPTVIIGRTDSTGALTTGAFNWESTLNNLYLEGGSDLINGAITKASGTNNALLDVMAGSDIVQNGYAISSSSTYGQLSTIFDADYALAGGAIVLNSFASINSNGGYITMGGGANPATTAAVGDASYNSGISLYGASLNAGGGNISIRGNGLTSTTNNSAIGVQIVSGSTVQTNGTGTIGLYGTGGGTGTSQGDYGVWINGAGADVQVANGNLTINGTATNNSASTGGYDQGVRIAASAVAETVGTGSINITGTGAGAGNTQYNDGVLVGGGAIVRSTNSAGGAINITGYAGDNGGTGNNNYGVSVSNTALVTSLFGNINVTGTGSTSTGIGPSVDIDQSASITSTGAANIALTGIGASAGNYGIGTVLTGSNIIGGASDTGNITLTADSISFAYLTAQTAGTVTIAPYTASTTVGVAGGTGTLAVTQAILNSITAGTIAIGATNDTGAMNVNASTWAENAQLISGSGLITISGAQALGAHNFTVQTDTTPVLSSTITSTGTVNIEPATASTSIGFSGGVGTLQITQAMMNSINAPTVIIGRLDSTGALTTGAFNWESTLNNLYLEGGSDTIGGNITKATGTNNALLDVISGSDIVQSSGVGISSSSTYGQLNTIFDANTALAGGAILMNASTSINSNGGNITLGGGSTPATTAAVGDATNNYGVYLNNTVTLNAAGGNIILNGQGYNSSAGSMYGVDLYNATISTSGSGTITMVGTGGVDSGGINYGIIMGYGDAISSTNGNISLTGYGSGSGNSNYGFNANASTINSTGGAINITGTSNATGGGGSNNGITMGSNGLTIQSTSGNITLTGTAANTGYGTDVGVGLKNITITDGSGNIAINGTGKGSGSGDYGVTIGNSASVNTTGTGAITFTGIGSNGAQGIYSTISSGSDTIGGSTDNGNITFITDAINLASINTQSLQSVILQPYTASTSIAFGGTGSSGTLGITQAMMDAINAPTVIIGRADSTGALTTGTFNWESTLNNLYLEGGSDTINGSITKASGTNNALLDVIAGADIFLNASDSISSSSTYGQLSTTFDADTALAGGAIKMYSGSSILSNGGAIILGGGATPTTGYVVGDATASNGINISGTSLNAGGGNIIMNGQGYVGTTNNLYGIQVSAGSIVQTSGAGAITLNGIGGGTGASNNDSGVYVTGTGSTVKTTGTGTLSLTGTGGDLGGTGYNNIGFDVDSGGTVAALGTGNIVIQGTGGTGSGSSNSGSGTNYGLYIASGVAGSNGSISLTGTGGNSAGTYNIGVQFNSGGSVSATGNGTITINGTGGGTGSNERGINTNAGSISAVNGAITLNGTGVNSGQGLSFKDAFSITSSGNAPINLNSLAGLLYFYNSGTAAAQTFGGSGYSGNIKLITDSITATNIPTFQTTGTVTIAPYTASDTITLGGTSSSAYLAITQAIMDAINAPTVIIGRTDSTGVLQTGTFNWENTLNNLYLEGGSDTITGAITKASGTNNALLNVISATDIVQNANISISSSGSYGQLNTIFDADTAAGGGAIVLNAGASILSNGGSITLGGGATPATGFAVGDATSQYGISLASTNATMLNAGSGNIILNGQGYATTASSNYGINIGSSAIIQGTGAGTITLTGIGGGTGASSNNYGIYEGATVKNTASGGGAITMIGYGGDSGGTGTSNIGFNSSTSSTVSSVDGNIIIDGNYGISGQTVSTASGGNVYYNGVIGINTQGAITSSGNATINLTGIGGGSGTSFGNDGIEIANGSISSTSATGGGITITGYSGTNNGSGNSNDGVFVGKAVSSANGAIVVNGNTGISGQAVTTSISNTNIGIQVDSGTVTATGTASITFNGLGAGGSGSSYGNDGIEMDSGSGPIATISAVSGNININGTGAATVNPSNYGVTLNSNSTIYTTGSGNIVLTGIGGNGAYGIKTSATTGTDPIGGASDTGNITLIADTLSLANYAAQTTGNVTYKPYTASTTIGFSGGAGTLQVTQAIMDATNAPTVIVGRTDSTGALTTGAFSWESTLNNLYLEGGSDTISGAITKASGTNNALLDLISATDISQGAYAISSSSTYGQLSAIFDADYALAGGAIILNSGASITSNGGNITMGGGTGTISAGSGYAVGDNANIIGIALNNSTINASGGNIVLNGQGYLNVVAAAAYGIESYSGSVIQTNSNGTISLNGLGGGNGAGASNFGIYLANSGTKIVGANGLISLTGTGGDTGGSGNNNNGVNIGSSTQVQTTGSGGVTIMGTGGANTSYGVFVGNSSASVSSTASGAISVTGIAGSGTDASIGSGSADSFGGASDTGTVTLTADSLNLGGAAIQTTGAVTIKPYTASTTIGVAGGTGILAVTQSLINSITAGSITIGATGDTGAMNVAAGTWTVPVNFISGNSGSITTTGALTGTGSGAFAFTGPTTIGGNVTTANQAITFNSPVTLSANDMMNAGTGTLTFGSTVNGAYNLTATAGTMSFGGALGGTTALGNVALTSTNNLSLPAITAIGTATLTTAGNLTVGNAINGTSGNALNTILSAGGYIYDTGNINTYGGNLIFRANNADVINSSASYAAIDLEGSPILQTGGGNITLGGGSASDTNGNPTGYAFSSAKTGIQLVNASLNAGGGNITVMGKATGGAGNPGLNDNGTSFITSGAGNITLNGYESGTAYGLTLSNGLTISTGSGTIQLTGSGGYANGGILLQPNAATQNIYTTSGNITLTGTEVSGLGKGINFAMGTAKIYSTSGNLSLVGTGTGSSSDIALSGTDYIGTDGSTNTTIGNVLVNAAGIGGIILPSTTTIAVSGAGNITFNAGAGAFINNKGTNALSVGTGRWLIYSNMPGADTFGSLDSGNTAIWNATYGGTISQSGNRYVFAYQPTVTFTSTNDSKTYGVDATTAVAGDYTVSGLQAGVTGAYLADSNATTFSGTASVTSTGSAATANVSGSPYAITVAQGTLTGVDGYALAYSSPGHLSLTQRTVTIDPTAGQSKIYGVIDPTLAYTTDAATSTTGLINGDTLSGGISYAGAGHYTGVGNCATTLGNLSNSNYNIVLESSAPTFSITQRAVTIDPTAGQSKIYGTVDPTLAYTTDAATGTTGLVHGDTLSGGISYSGADQYTNVGNYATTLGNLSNSNYNIILEGSAPTFGITQRTVTIDPTAGQSKIYGVIDPTLAYTAETANGTTGLVNGDALSGSVSYSGAGQYTGVGNYATTLGSLVNSNYNIVLESSAPTFGITQRTVTIDPTTGQSKIYGTVDPTLAYTTDAATGTTGLVNGDTLSGSVSYSGAGQYANVGNYTTTLGSLANSNYNIVLESSAPTFGITQRTVTIDPTAGQSKIYGTVDPTLAYTTDAATGTTGLVNGDVFSGALSYADAGQYTGVGLYAVSMGTLGNGNYMVSLETGAPTFNITSRTVTIDPTTGQSKIYGTVDPTLAYTTDAATGTTGLVHGDTLSGGISYAGAGQYTNVGNYATTLGNLSNSNYNIVLEAIVPTFGITQRTVTVSPTAGQSKIYGSVDPTIAYTTATATGTTGLVNGDTLSGDVSYAGAGQYKGVGNYITNLGNLANGNYNIVLAGGSAPTFGITARAITITASDQSQTYGDGDSLTQGYTIGGLGLAGTDAISAVSLTTDAILNSTNTQYDYRANPWTITAANATGTGGFNTTNYNITYDAGALSVAQKSLNVNGLSASNKMYDGTTSATISGTATFSGKILGDTLSLNASGASVQFADSNVGTAKSVTVSGLVLNGADANNYSSSIDNSGITATITARPLTISTNSASKTYGDADPIFVGSANLVAADTGLVSLTYAPVAYSGNAGSYTIAAIASDPNNRLANYTITDNYGTLSVSKRDITATLQNQILSNGRLLTALDQNNPANVVWSGLVNSDSPASLDNVTFSYGGALAGIANRTGSYALGIGSFADNNYNLTSFAPGTLTITTPPALISLLPPTVQRAPVDSGLNLYNNINYSPLSTAGIGASANNEVIIEVNTPNYQQNEIMGPFNNSNHSFSRLDPTAALTDQTDSQYADSSFNRYGFQPIYLTIDPGLAKELGLR